MRFRVELKGPVYRLARDKAGDDASLARLIVAYVTAYATGQTAQQRAGRLVSDRMTPEQRSERARLAGRASAAARLRQVAEE